jgi:hypothetical protein
MRSAVLGVCLGGLGIVTAVGLWGTDRFPVWGAVVFGVAMLVVGAVSHRFDE